MLGTRIVITDELLNQLGDQFQYSIQKNEFGMTFERYLEKQIHVMENSLYKYEDIPITDDLGCCSVCYKEIDEDDSIVFTHVITHEDCWWKENSKQQKK